MLGKNQSQNQSQYEQWKIEQLDREVDAIGQSMKVDSLNLDNWERKVRENFATIVKDVYRDEQ